MAKMISVSFYFGEIILDGFHRKFGLPLQKAFPREVDFLIDPGLMEPAQAGQVLRLTPAGILNVNGVIALFYTGSVKAQLINSDN